VFLKLLRDKLLVKLPFWPPSSPVKLLTFNSLVKPPSKLLACPVKLPTFNPLVKLLIFCVILPVSLLISKVLARFVNLLISNPDILIFETWSLKLLIFIPLFCNFDKFCCKDLTSIELANNLLGSILLIFSKSDKDFTSNPRLFNFFKSSTNLIESTPSSNNDL